MSLVGLVLSGLFAALGMTDTPWHSLLSTLTAFGAFFAGVAAIGQFGLKLHRDGLFRAVFGWFRGKSIERKARRARHRPY